MSIATGLDYHLLTYYNRQWYRKITRRLLELSNRALLLSPS